MTNIAMLQTAADLSASITAQGVSSLVPAGVIMAFGGATAPTGWLLCNGSAISRSTYADLFAAIGVAHGYGDNSTTFNLPDYRGRFMRGRDGAVARDPNAATRTAANTGGNTGDNVGSVQTNATAKNGLTATSSAVGGSDGTHSHTSIPLNIPSTAGYAGFSGYATSGGVQNNGSTGSTSSGHGHAAPTITIGAGDSETRPLNAYVNYIIKI